MTSGPMGRAGGLFWPACFVLVAALAAYPALMIRPPMWDTCYYSYIGQRLVAGDILYRDIWDQKLPVMYWFEALAAATGRQRVALYGLEVLAIAGGAWMLYRMTRGAFSHTCAGLVGVTYITLASTTATIDFGNLTEHWAAPFVILCIYAMTRLAGRDPGRRRGLLWAAVSGFGLGAATCLRPPAIVIGAALLALAPSVWRRGLARPLALWVAGFLAVPIAVVLWATFNGVLWPMLDSCFVFNAQYAADNPAWATWARLGQLVKDLITATWLWHLLGAGGLLVLLAEWAAEKDKARRDGQPAPRPLVNLRGVAIIWVLAAFASALSGLRFYVHYYYLALAPVALLSAWAWNWEERLRQSRVSWARILIGYSFIWAFATLLILHQWSVWKQSSREREPLGAIVQARDYLASRGTPGQTICVFPWGAETRILADLGWKCPSRFPGGRAFGDSAPFVRLLHEWQKELLAHPPDWLVCSVGDDLIAGPPFLPICGWDRPEVAAVGVELHDAFQDLYVAQARFTGYTADHQPGTIVVVYKRK